MEHLKTKHNAGTNEPILYLTRHKTTYGIPKKIAEKYIIDVDAMDLIPAEIVFAKLINQYGKSAVLLRGLRLKEGLKQIEFAKKINITQKSLSHMENGRLPIEKNIAKRIEKAFGMDYRRFLE